MILRSVRRLGDFGSLQWALLLACTWTLTACATTQRGPLPPGPHDGIRFVEANGLTFGYLELAEGPDEQQGPLVLLLHGFPDTAHTFAALLPKLAASGYRPVAVFQRGYAPSDAPEDGDYSVVARGRDVIALIDALGAQCAIVVGHDWGASAAYAAAHQAPEKIHALVTVALPHGRTARLTSLPQIVRARHGIYFQLPWAGRLAQRNDFDYLQKLYRRWSPGWSVSEEHLDTVRQAFTEPERMRAAISYYRAFLRDLVRPSGRRANRAQTRVPNLLIAGSRDGAVVRRSIERHCMFVDDCRLEWIEDAGHFPHLEQPDAFAKILLEYLGPASNRSSCVRDSASAE